MHVKYYVSILFISSTVVFGQDLTQKLEFIIPKHEITAVEKFVDRAIQYALDHTIDETCISFKHDVQWNYPNAELILFDNKDIIWLCTSEEALTWDKQQLPLLKTPENVLLTKVTREKADNGEWIPFLIWQNDITNGYFKNFTKDGASFTIGLLIFPQNTLHEIAKLVLKTSNFLKENGLYDTINAVNRLVGPFIQGNLSVSLYNQDGIGIADSYDVTRVGLGSDFWFDDNHKNVFKSFEDAADNERNFGWSVNPFHGHNRKTFILRKHNKDSQQYTFLTSGFYDIDDDYVINLTRKAKAILLKHGTELFEQPSKIGTEASIVRLNIAIYDDKGILQLHSRYPSLRGVNLFNHQDHAGNYITKQIIETAMTKGHGWVFSYIFNAVQPIYVEKVTLPTGTFIVTVQGYTPISRKHIIANRAEIICRFLLDHSLKETMGALTLQKEHPSLSLEAWSHAGYFYRLYNESNYCLSAGPHYNKIWDKADQEVIDFLQKLTTQKKGGDWLLYKRGMKTYHVYVKKCSKTPTENYSIVVGYVSITTKGKDQ